MPCDISIAEAETLAAFSPEETTAWKPHSQLDVMIRMWHTGLPGSLSRRVMAGISKCFALLQMDQRNLSLGTGCSGSDIAVKCFDCLVNYWHKHCGFNVKALWHMLSAESDCTIP